MNDQLILYSMASCPFCHRVLQFLEDQDINIPVKDIIENPSYRQELIELGGKSQVPCLIINNKPMYESADIINWVQDNLI